MSTAEEEVGITSLFGGSGASDERELAIDEGVYRTSATSNSQFVPDLNVVVRERGEWVRRELEEVEASGSWAEEASEGHNFVDNMGSLDKDTGGESEGFKFADNLQRADLLSEIVLGGVVETPDLPLC